MGLARGAGRWCSAGSGVLAGWSACPAWHLQVDLEVMLSYEIRQLEHQASWVDGELSPADPIWSDGDAVPAGPVHATGRLSKAGSWRYYWSGRIEGTAAVACRRCLADLSVLVAEDVHVIFVGAGDEVAEDPDAYRLPPHAQVIDLRPAIREQWLLSVPGFVLCREDCRGLCARCGADLNAGPCGCPPEADSRWDALRAIRDTSR